MQDDFWQQAQDLYSHLQKGEIYYRPEVGKGMSLIDVGIREAVEKSGHSMNDLDPRFDETFREKVILYARQLYDRLKNGEMYIPHRGVEGVSLDVLIPGLLRVASASLDELDPGKKATQVRAEFDAYCTAATKDSTQQLRRMAETLGE